MSRAGAFRQDVDLDSFLFRVRGLFTKTAPDSRPCLSLKDCQVEPPVAARSCSRLARTSPLGFWRPEPRLAGPKKRREPLARRLGASRLILPRCRGAAGRGAAGWGAAGRGAAGRGAAGRGRLWQGACGGRAKFAIALGCALPLGSPRRQFDCPKNSLPLCRMRSFVSLAGSRIDRKVVYIARKSLDLLAFRGEGSLRAPQT